MQIGRWLGVCEAETISVGCERHTLLEWGEQLDAIADKHSATPYERALVRGFLALCADVQRVPGYGKKP